MYNSEVLGSAMRSVTRAPYAIPEIKKHLNDVKKFSSSIWTSKPSVKIDNFILTLHSVITVNILMVGTMFVSMRQYFGEPIDCLTKDSDIKASLIEHYCWIEGAFSVLGGGETGTAAAYPGVAPTTSASIKRHHKYYQWVYFVLIIQAIMFYLPKFLWRTTESGRLKDLIARLSGKSVAEVDERSRIALVQEVADNLGIAHNYMVTVILCEIYCLLHLAVQIWFTNIFLGGAFYTLGIKWLTYANTHSSPNDDPLISIFPRMVKCTFHKYGFSGTMETKDALCFLPLNIVNEKIYAILWIWFAALFAVTSLHLIVETIFISFRPLRILRVSWLAPGCNQRFVRGICKRAGQWLVLSFLANNIKPSHFRDLMDCLERDHFDSKGRPLHISRVGEALTIRNASRTASANSSPAKSCWPSKKPSKKTYNNSILASALNTNLTQWGVAKQPNFCRKNNCEPPSPGFVVETNDSWYNTDAGWDIQGNGDTEETKLTCDNRDEGWIYNPVNSDNYGHPSGRSGEGCSGGNIDWPSDLADWGQAPNEEDEDEDDEDDDDEDDDDEYDGPPPAKLNSNIDKTVVWPKD